MRAASLLKYIEKVEDKKEVLVKKSFETSQCNISIKAFIPREIESGVPF